MRSRLWKGLVAGGVAGFAASLVMTGCQKVWSEASGVVKNAHGGKNNNPEVKEPTREEGEDATIKAATRLFSLAGRNLSPEEKPKAGSVVHYLFGTTMGALYGAAIEYAPRQFRRFHPAFLGAGYGSALFVGAHEVAVPSLRLAGKPTEEPLSDHVREWALHLAYGISEEVVRRLLRDRL